MRQFTTKGAPPVRPLDTEAPVDAGGKETDQAPAPSRVSPSAQKTVDEPPQLATEPPQIAPEPPQLATERPQEETSSVAPSHNPDENSAQIWIEPRVEPSESPTEAPLEELLEKVAVCGRLVRQGGEVLATECQRQASLVAELESLGNNLREFARFQEKTLERARKESVGREADDLHPSEAARGLYGPLDQVTVIEVLEFVRLTRKTGVLCVTSPTVTGFLHVVEGEAIYAENGDQTGFDAFRELMAAEVGHVEFRSEEVDRETSNLTRGTLELMMQALRLLDERNSQLRR